MKKWRDATFKCPKCKRLMEWSLSSVDDHSKVHIFRHRNDGAAENCTLTCIEFWEKGLKDE